tara:strand:- start:423 stop:644 length:222 start_codon:yes stop_codon:yes gene_type:complete
MESSLAPTAPTPPTPPTTQPSAEQQKLVNVDIENENIALNVLVGFCNLGQQRGVFNIQESAKIWECIQKFQKE